MRRGGISVAIASALAFSTCLGSARAEEPVGANFEKHVAPLLSRHCLNCHNASEHNGGLDLTNSAGALAGGETSPAVVPRNVDDSYLLQRVRDGEMPPLGKGRKLTAEEVGQLTAWVRDGAAWPAGRALSQFEFTTDKRAGVDWWSLRPPARPAVPDVKTPAWVRNPIDAFILRELERRGLSPAPEADRPTFIRRAKLDLLGLPPTPDEVQAFVADRSPDAYEKLIDGFLASRHYGERWARHWLDVVRFGETNGYETNTPRPSAWPFRDYVIDSFNRDTPYPRFVLEQLAGDQVGVDVGTGFIVGGTHDVVGIANIEGQLQQRANDLDDMLGTTANAFLGLTVGCARCHDHKFDPISQRDYYALQAVFAGVAHAERPWRTPVDEQRLKEEQELRRQLASIESEIAVLLTAHEPLAAANSSPDQPAAARRSPVSPLRNVDRFAPVAARFVRFTVLTTNSVEPCLDELEIFTAEKNSRNIALASAGAKVTASSVYQNGSSPIHKIEHVNDGRYGNSRSWISSELGVGWVRIELPEVAQIDRVAWARDREGAFVDRLATKYKIEVALEPDAWKTVATSDDRRPFQPQGPRAAADGVEHLPSEAAAEYRRLAARRAELSARLPQTKSQMIYAGTFSQPGATHRLHRGDPVQKKEEVAPGGLAAVRPSLTLPSNAPEAERRVALARWIGDPANPLSARVMVNRLWQHHFGAGIVRTPSNFGFHGGQPTHPELLDWLATEFVARGWRPKALHRLIVLSATYRQASLANPAAVAVDAQAQYLWRYPPRRLEAEPIRDAILSISGALDLRPGGPGWDPFEPNSNYVHVFTPKTRFGAEDWRRMIYMTKQRMVQDVTFGAFDCPDAAQPMAKRNVSTTALQALNLLNGPFVVQQAGLFAERVRKDAGDDPAAQTRRAFALAFGRQPDEDELQAAMRVIGEHGLPALCRAVLNSSELIFLP